MSAGPLAAMPCIDDPGFVLRPLRRADLADWYAYLSQPIVYEHTSWNLASPDDLLSLFDAYESADPDAPLRFAIARRASDQLVGTVGLHTISSLHRTAELAYDLSPQVWGRGLATRCARATIDWAMARLRLHRLQATVLPSNAASIRVIERCGMQQEGTLRNFRRVRGVPMDFFIYSLTA